MENQLALAERALAPTKGRTVPLLPIAALALVVASVAVPAYNGGVLLGIDLLFLVIAPVLVPVVLQSRFLKAVWATALLWAGVQLLSDVVHGAGLLSAPTVAGPTAALIATGLYWLHTKLNVSVPAVVAAVGLGWLGLEFVSGQALATSNPWKYGFAIPTVVAVLAVAYVRKFKTRTVMVLLGILAVVSLQFDSRFETGLLLACAAAMMVGGMRREVGRRGLWRLLVLIVVGGGLYAAYPALALSGVLGERAYAQQLIYEFDGSNFLLATRLEFPQMLYLVAQNPLLGIGSYARLEASQAFEALQFLNENVAPLTDNAKNYMLSPASGYTGYNAHSGALASALFAGVLALPFWVLLLLAALRGILKFSQGFAVVPALLIYMCGTSVWDALFSPLTTRSHLVIGVTLFLVAVTLAKTSQIPSAEPLQPPGATND